MKITNWQYNGTAQTVGADVAYQITDPVTGEVIDRVNKIEVPAASLDLTGVKSFADITARIAAAVSPKTASKGTVAVAVAAPVVVAEKPLVG